MSIKSINGIKILLVILTLILTTTLPQGSAVKKPASIKWLTQKVWRGTFAIDRRVSKSTSFMGVSEKIELIEHTTGSVSFGERYTEDSMGTWHGPVSAHTSITATRTLSFGSVTMTEKVSGNGSSHDDNEYGETSSLAIDINDKRYDVGFSGGDPDIKWTREMDGATVSAVNKIEAAPIRAYFMALFKGLDKGNFSTGLTSGIGFLPGNQRELMDVASWFEASKGEQGHKLPSSPGSLSGSDIYDKNGTFIKTTWSLSPSNVVKPAYLLTIENLPEFKTMIPDPEKIIRLKVYTKDKNPVAVPVRFTIEDPSKEPGICLNSGDRNDTDDDIEFDLESGGTKLYKDGELSVLTRDAVTQAYVDVKIKDYAAYGTIYAEIVLDNLRERIKVDFSGEKELTIPFDENGNHMADQWEKDKKIYSNPTNVNEEDDKETKPELNGVDGDGLTVFEEYRGIMVGGEHLRLDPKIKELIVENRSDNLKIKMGIKLFDKASGIKVVELKNGDLSGDRVVNVNSKAHKNNDQHGVILETATLGEGISGQTNPIEKERKTPKDVRNVVISDFAFRPWAELSEEEKEINPRGQWESNVSVTVAHELAHTVKGEHHGDREDPSQMIYQYDIVLDEHGIVIEPLINGEKNPRRPESSPNPTGKKHGESSGDVRCIMCYNNYYAMISFYQGRKRAYQFTPSPKYYSQTIFCTSPKGTGINAGGEWFGDADVSRGRGDCIHKMQIRD